MIPPNYPNKQEVGVAQVIIAIVVFIIATCSSPFVKHEGFVLHKLVYFGLVVYLGIVAYLGIINMRSTISEKKIED